MRSVTVLGVDPGLTRFGFGLVKKDANRSLSRVTSGVLKSDKSSEEQQRLFEIGTQFTLLLDEHRPDCIALERIFAQANLHSVMAVAQISGIVNFEASKRQIPVVLYTPTQVKAQVSGYGKADKQQVSIMVQKILRLEHISAIADETDALALALCHHLAGQQLASAKQRQMNVKTLSQQSQKSAPLTPAQQKWLEAERQARNSGTVL